MLTGFNLAWHCLAPPHPVLLPFRASPFAIIKTRFCNSPVTPPFPSCGRCCLPGSRAHFPQAVVPRLIQHSRHGYEVDHSYKLAPRADGHLRGKHRQGVAWVVSKLMHTGWRLALICGAA